MHSQVTLRIVIVGPGRVGSALAHRLVAAGVHLEGFVGRSAASTARAIAFCGGGRALGWPDLRRAHVVVFAVGDADLHGAIAAAAAGGGARDCGLWLHTSGRHGLDVFAAAGPGIRRGALHPVAPMPDAASGMAALAGAPALVEGDARSGRLLRRLCHLLGLLPIEAHGPDRVLYHAACALAANGLTALRAAVERTFAAAGGLEAAQQRSLADALMGAALRACSTLGPAAALSGPVRRGDSAVVAAHLDGLTAAAPAVVPVYRALMLEALALSTGLPDAATRELRRVLRPRSGGD